MNIPNFLTIIRIILVPVYLYLFVRNGYTLSIDGLIIFVLAGATDVLDGTIARTYNMETKLGTLLDPLADKLMMIAVIITLFLSGSINIGFVLFFIVRELLHILGAAFLFFNTKKEVVLPSDAKGKYTTLLFYFSVVATMLGANKQLVNGLFLATIVLGFLATFNYFKLFIQNLKKSKED